MPLYVKYYSDSTINDNGDAKTVYNRLTHAPLIKSFYRS